MGSKTFIMKWLVNYWTKSLSRFCLLVLIILPKENFKNKTAYVRFEVIQRPVRVCADGFHFENRLKRLFTSLFVEIFDFVCQTRYESSLESEGLFSWFGIKELSKNIIWSNFFLNVIVFKFLMVIECAKMVLKLKSERRKEKSEFFKLHWFENFLSFRLPIVTKFFFFDTVVL